MVELKTVSELELMRKAGEISANALIRGGEAVKVGATTADIDRVVREYILSQGAKPNFLGLYGFPGSACISINDEIIHGIPGERVIKDGDIVSIDTGASFGGYNGDNAATFAAGNVSDEAKRLIAATREALLLGVDQARKGNRIGDIGAAVQQYVESKGYSVVREYVGHGVGRELHEDPEVPNYGHRGHGTRLVPGMTIAIEPMVDAGTYVTRTQPNGWTVVTADGSLSAHFEFTVAITDGAPLVLTPHLG